MSDLISASLDHLLVTWHLALQHVTYSKIAIDTLLCNMFRPNLIYYVRVIEWMSIVQEDQSSDCA